MTNEEQIALLNARMSMAEESIAGLLTQSERLLTACEKLMEYVGKLQNTTK